MSLTGTLSSKIYIMEDTAIITDDCCLSNHDSIGVIKHDSFTDLGSWMNAQAYDLRSLRLEGEC